MNNEPDDQKPRGRPRVLEPLSPVSTRLRPAEHDKLIEIANKRDTSVSSVVRQLLRQTLR